MAESREGQGSRFTIYFPSVDRKAARPSEPIQTESPRGRETILLAEDDEAVRQLGKRILENAGYRVLIASDGEEALEVFDRFQDSIDLMLLDVVMPKLGGRALMDRVQTKCARMKFLFSSGYSEGALHSGFVLEAGIDLIQKPYRAEKSCFGGVAKRLNTERFLTGSRPQLEPEGELTYVFRNRVFLSSLKHIPPW